GIDDPAFDAQHDQARWPALKKKLVEIIATRTRAEWEQTFAGKDACFAPVLTMRDAPGHPHNVAREAFVTREGVTQPGVVPKFSATPGAIQHGPAAALVGIEAALAAWGAA